MDTSPLDSGAAIRTYLDVEYMEEDLEIPKKSASTPKDAEMEEFKALKARLHEHTRGRTRAQFAENKVRNLSYMHSLSSPQLISEGSISIENAVCKCQRS